MGTRSLVLTAELHEAMDAMAEAHANAYRTGFRAGVAGMSSDCFRRLLRDNVPPLFISLKLATEGLESGVYGYRAGQALRERNT